MDDVLERELTPYERLLLYTSAWTDEEMYHHGRTNPKVIGLMPPIYRDVMVTWDNSFYVSMPWIEGDGNIVFYDTRKPIPFGCFTLRRVILTDPDKVRALNMIPWTPESPLPGES